MPSLCPPTPSRLMSTWAHAEGKPLAGLSSQGQSQGWWNENSYNYLKILFSPFQVIAALTKWNLGSMGFGAFLGCSRHRSSQRGSLTGIQPSLPWQAANQINNHYHSVRKLSIKLLYLFNFSLQDTIIRMRNENVFKWNHETLPKCSFSRTYCWVIVVIFQFDWRSGRIVSATGGHK